MSTPTTAIVLLEEGAVAAEEAVGMEMAAAAAHAHHVDLAVLAALGAAAVEAEAVVAETMAATGS